MQWIPSHCDGQLVASGKANVLAYVGNQVADMFAGQAAPFHQVSDFAIQQVCDVDALVTGVIHRLVAINLDMAQKGAFPLVARQPIVSAWTKNQVLLNASAHNLVRVKAAWKCLACGLTKHLPCPVSYTHLTLPTIYSV